MTELKVGDRVRFIGQCETSDAFLDLFTMQTLGTVVTSHDTACTVKFDGVARTKTCSHHNLEAVYASEDYAEEPHIAQERGVFAAAKEGFVTKDSGQRQGFGNGSVRDTEEGKPRYDLISPIASKRRAELMARGAVKYGERNWELGQYTSRFLSSLMRHTEMYRLGDRSEDHLAAIGYNADGMAHFEGTEWDDINDH